MGIKVKTKVNFNEIIEKLHKVAKDFAEKKSGGKVELENIAFDDQNGKFLGGGEFAIFMKQKEGVVSENDKGRFLEIIKEYVHYFVGEEESKYIDEDSLQPIYLDSTAGKEEVEEIMRKKDEEEKQKAEKQEKEKRNLSLSTGSFNVNNESQFFKHGTKKMLNLLFESDGKDESEESSREETKDENNDNEAKCIGYGVAYAIEANGKKDWSIAKAISNKAKGLFGGIAADLLNIKIKIGGEPVNLGHILDPKKWMEKIGMKDIDASQVASDMEKAFDNDFKHNEAQISVEDNEDLKTSLNRMVKNSPEFRKKMEEGKGLFSGLISKLKKCKYSVLIQVKEKDPWYPKYNTDSIAKTASKAFGTTYNVVDWNKVSKDDVIKIDNAEHIKPQKKEWDPERALGDFVKKYNTEMNKGEKSDKNKTKKLDEEKDIIEKDEKNKEDEKIHQFFKEKIDEQVDKVLGGENVIDSDIVSIEDFINSERFKELNDSKLREQISQSGDELLYIQIRKEVSDKQLRESFNRRLMSKMFNDKSLIFESEQSEMTSFLNKYFEYIHINPADKEEDDKCRSNMKNVANELDSIDDAQNKLIKKCQKVINNSIIDTRKEFKIESKNDGIDDIIATYQLIEKQKSTNESIIFEEEQKYDKDFFKISDKMVSVNGALGGHLTKLGKSAMNNPGLHFSPWGAIHTVQVISKYMEKHNLSVKSIEQLEKDKEKYPYVALVIAKRNEDHQRKQKKETNEAMQGSLQQEAYTDESINDIFDKVASTTNCKINRPFGKESIACDDAKELKANNKDVIDMQFIEQFKSLGYNQDSSKTVEPKLDIWICQFADDKKEETPTEGNGEGNTNIDIDVDINITKNTINNYTFNIFQSPIQNITNINIRNMIMNFFVILIDPIKKIKPQTQPQQKDDTKTNNRVDRVDWYIIPHRGIKDKGDRNMQRSTDSHGITTTSTSDKEYKPKGK